MSARGADAHSRHYVCVHGHFYQPPRESPWLDAIEEQPSARPFHDWNQRVSAECYRPNAFARVLDGKGRIERIVNNYQRMSWNFGPTLLSWMEGAEPELYRAIVEADRERVLKTRHGAGLAQVYGHAILPLCNERDRETHVRWGAADFEHRFGRRSRGMWLAETACDTASLEALARNGIDFTVLAPHQAQKARAKGGRWHDARGSRIDPRRPYQVHLPSGRSIQIFFYDGPASRAVAFERLLDDGLRFRDRLLAGFDPRSHEPQLVHIATDGESYGHHHRFGEMALAYALEALEQDPRVRLTTYEEMLALHPAGYEAAIVENTSWSCAHGIERWRSDCGCSTGAQAGWNQSFRGPLRDALDGLRDGVNAHWEPLASELFHDPWGARDRYVSLLLDGSIAARDQFLARELRASALGPIPSDLVLRALELLELQRHLLLMYTSCGWFFADLGGIETVQIIRYAARAVELATSLFGDRFESSFVSALARARSNLADGGDGATIFRREVASARVDLGRAAAHFAARSLFERRGGAGRDTAAAGFEVRFTERTEERSGRARLSTGALEVCERKTTRSASFDYAAVHLGDHNLGGGVRAATEPNDRATMRAELAAVFRAFDLPELLRSLERHFPGTTFSLRSLFFDEQARVVSELLSGTRADIDRVCEQLYEEHAPLMRYLATLGQEPPAAMRHAATHALSARLHAAMGRPELDLPVLEGTREEARATGVALDRELLAPVFVAAFEQQLSVGTGAALRPAAIIAELLVGLAPEPHLIARAEEALVRARDRGAAAGPDPEARELMVRLAGLLRVALHT